MTDFEGIQKLVKYLEKCVASADPDSILASQKAGAEHMIDKLKYLSSPRRTGKMLASFAYKQNTASVETELGWGLFYGRLKESGHYTRQAKKTRTKKSGTAGKRFVTAQPHLKPTFEANKTLITQTMVDEIERRK